MENPQKNTVELPHLVLQNLLVKIQSSTSCVLWQYDLITGKLHWLGDPSSVFGNSLLNIPVDIQDFLSLIAAKDVSIFQSYIDQPQRLESNSMEFFFANEEGTKEVYFKLGLYQKKPSEPFIQGFLQRMKETEVDERQKMLDFLYEKSKEGFCVTGFDGYFKVLNPTILKILGYSEKELKSRPFIEFVHPDDVEATLKEAENLTKEGYHTVQFENRYRMKNGAYQWLSWTAISKVEKNLIYATIRSVQKEKQQEEYLHILKSTFDYSRDAILISDANPTTPNPIILYANPAFTEMTGYAAEEIIGNSPRILQGKGTDVNTTKYIRQELEKWNRVEADILNYKKDGTPFWVSLSITPIANETGWFTHWVSIQRDITEQKKIENELKRSLLKTQNLYYDLVEKEQKLRESERTLWAFFKHTPGIAWIVNKEGRLIYANPSYEEIVNKPLSKVVNKTVFELYSEKDSNRYFKTTEYVLTEHRDIKYEESVIYHNGKEATFSIVKFPIDRGNGDVVVGGIALDVTTEREAKRNLEESEERYRSIFQFSKDIITIIDKEGIIQDINNTRDIDKASVIGTNISDWFADQQELENYLACKKIVFEEGIPQNYDITYFYPTTGEIQYFESVISPILKNGKVDYATIFARDITEYKHALNSLAESEQRYRMLSENSVDIIWTMTDDMQFNYVSPSVEKVYGYTPEEFLQCSYVDLLTPDSLEKAMLSHRVERAKLEGLHPDKSIELYNELEQVRKDGTTFWTEVITKRLKDKDGNNIGFIGSTRDITFKIETRRELASKQALLGATQSLAKIGGWEVDLNNNQLTWTAGVHQIHETDPHTFTPDVNTAIGFYKKEHQPVIRAAFRNLIERGKPYDLELEIVTTSGAVRHVHVFGKAIVEEGKITHALGAIQDITERKRNENYNRMLESAVVNAKDAILITDASSIDDPLGPKIIYVNDAFCNMTGYTHEEIIGQTPRILQGRKSQREKLDYIRKNLTEFNIIETELINYKKDGTPFWVHLTIVPVADKTGWYTHWVSVQRDVTERHKYQEELEQEVKKRTRDLAKMNNKLARFASIASHDMKAPLRMITSYLQLLEKRAGTKLNENEKDFIHYALNGSENLYSLIEGILEYSRIKEDRTKWILVDLNETIANLLIQNHHEIMETKAIIEYENLPEITANKTQMHQLFANLINNALKFRKKDTIPQICITYFSTDEEYCFKISDNGIGMEAKQLTKIFDFSYRLHSSTEYKGHGVGLSICKEIVESHEGEIWATSTLGVGTTFHIKIPK